MYRYTHLNVASRYDMPIPDAFTLNAKRFTKYNNEQKGYVFPPAPSLAMCTYILSPFFSCVIKVANNNTKYRIIHDAYI